MGIGVQPCCCTGLECLLFEDNFNRANNAALGSGWLEPAGNTSIASNRLSMSTASSLAIATLPYVGSAVVLVKIRFTGSAGKARIILNYASAADHDYVEFSWVSGTLTIITLGSMVSGFDNPYGCGKRLNGTDALQANVDYPVTVCRDANNRLAATMGVGGSVGLISGPGLNSGDKAGLGVGNTSNVVLFDDFSLQRHGSADFKNCYTCPPAATVPCGCDVCLLDEAPREFDITFPVGHWTGCDCPPDNCNSSVGTIRVTWTGAFSGCVWTYEFPDQSMVCACGWNSLTLDILTIGVLMAQVTLHSWTHTVIWRYAMPDTDCSFPTETAIPFYRGNGNPTNCYWDGVGNALGVGTEAPCHIKGVA